MRKLFAVFVSLTLISGLAACTDKNSSSSAADSSKPYEAVEVLPFPDIKLSLPADYETTSSGYIDEFYKKGNASVIVTSKSNSQSMDSAVYDALLQYDNIADSLKEVSNESAEINGCEARIVEIRYSISGENDTLNMSCCFGFIIKNSTLYIITCSVPTSEYSQYSDEFKDIIKSAKPVNNTEITQIR